jgi:hypothetical protein
MFVLLDFHKHGTYTDGTYAHDTHSAWITGKHSTGNKHPEDAAYLDIYRSDIDGIETEVPILPERLVNSMDVKSVSGLITIRDSHPYGATAIDLLSDDAPSADYVAISNSSLYFSNAVTAPIFPYDIGSIWKINIANNNGINYVNRPIEFDLFDQNLHPDAENSYVNLDLSSLLSEYFRIMDFDMITPLECYLYEPAATSRELASGGVVHTNRIMKVIIPYLQAYTVHTIYLVIAGTPETVPYLVGYPSNYDFGTIYIQV